jgi:hypothetical protein
MNMTYADQQKRLTDIKDKIVPLKITMVAKGKLLEGIQAVSGTIRDMERLQALLDQIYICAKREREACIHCDSIAKAIEDSR